MAALRAQISRRRKGRNPNPLISREMDDDRLKVRSDITFCTMLHLLGDAASRSRQRKQIRKTTEWRDKVTVKQARELCKGDRRAYTMGSFSSGGCCDTLAAIGEGFIPICRSLAALKI